MKFWGSTEVPHKIEFISYAPEYREQTLNLIKNSFFQNETIMLGCQINENLEAQKEIQAMVEHVLQKSDVSIIARDVEKDLVVGVAMNLIHVKTLPNGEPGFFEKFRDQNCKTENAKEIMNFNIIAESKVDLFEHYQVDCLFEITFLSVMEEYKGKQIGSNLCKFSIELAQDLKNGKDIEKYLPPGHKTPQLVSAIWSAYGSQAVGAKLGFDVVFKEKVGVFEFNGKTFAERVGDPNLEYHVAAKRI